MPKKINIIFDDSIFEKLCQMKKKETYAKYLSQLVDDRFESMQKSEGENGADNGEAEVLQVSTKKLLSILNAINDRFTYITGLGDRMENLERALEGQAEVMESIERTAFENKECIGELKITQKAILEKFDNLQQNDISSTLPHAGDAHGVKNPPVAGIEDSSRITPSTDYEFACPKCDGTVDENDDYCQWCDYQLSEGEDNGRDYNAHHEHPGSAANSKYDYASREKSAVPGNARSGKWKYDIDDSFYPPSGPPSGWDGENIQIDSSGKPICQFCIDSMTFVQEYERWFCEACWYYAPSDFMVSKSIEPMGRGNKPAPKKKIPIVAKKRNNWKNRKLGELPLFKKKKDRR